jgi:multidrug resistance efflux pump
MNVGTCESKRSTHAGVHNETDFCRGFVLAQLDLTELERALHQARAEFLDATIESANATANYLEGAARLSTAERLDVLAMRNQAASVKLDAASLTLGIAATALRLALGSPT